MAEVARRKAAKEQREEEAFNRWVLADIAKTQRLKRERALAASEIAAAREERLVVDAISYLLLVFICSISCLLSLFHRVISSRLALLIIAYTSSASPSVSSSASVSESHLLVSVSVLSSSSSSSSC